MAKYRLVPSSNTVNCYWIERSERAQTIGGWATYERWIPCDCFNAESDAEAIQKFNTEAARRKVLEERAKLVLATL